MTERLVALEGIPRLKIFDAPWTRKGKQLLLACGRCQKKLRQEGGAQGLGRLKKALKAEARAQGRPLRLHVMKTPCLKVCPKRGVAVCTQAQLGTGRGTIVRTDADVALLLAVCGL